MRNEERIGKWKMERGKGKRETGKGKETLPSTVSFAEGEQRKRRKKGKERKNTGQGRGGIKLLRYEMCWSWLSWKKRGRDDERVKREGRAEAGRQARRRSSQSAIDGGRSAWCMRTCMHGPSAQKEGKRKRGNKEREGVKKVRGPRKEKKTKWNLCVCARTGQGTGCHCAAARVERRKRRSQMRK